MMLHKVSQGQRQSGVLLKRLQLLDQGSAITTQLLEVAHDVFLRLLFQLNERAAWQVRKSVLDVVRDGMFGGADQGAEFILEPVFLMRLSDEVEHGQALFALCPPPSVVHVPTVAGIRSDSR